ncbi:hypothetical protein [Streptomyces sp. NBC_00347]|uniref:hypothetical protein n=1 Tax=Streptomyces sp. NBC_00347 TaxID=2975721 RepID=UPI00225A7D14|nr:hypothetical protein [Streptomyces sp. NBC_00347]MCX5126830.1 hypothetical protein [Streptomyces sp. NBC_00347]
MRSHRLLADRWRCVGRLEVDAGLACGSEEVDAQLVEQPVCDIEEIAGVRVAPGEGRLFVFLAPRSGSSKKVAQAEQCTVRSGGAFHKEVECLR